jgi:hypothetical protein
MRWWGRWHVWGTRELHTRVWWGNLKKRDHLEDLGIEGRIILKWILNRIVKLRVDASGSGQEQKAGCCQYGNKPLDSIKCMKFE